MQGCTSYMQPPQGCVYFANDNHKVVCTLQKIMQACHNLAASVYFRADRGGKHPIVIVIVV